MDTGVVSIIPTPAQVRATALCGDSTVKRYRMYYESHVVPALLNTPAFVGDDDGLSISFSLVAPPFPSEPLCRWLCETLTAECAGWHVKVQALDIITIVAGFTDTRTTKMLSVIRVALLERAPATTESSTWIPAHIEAIRFTTCSAQSTH